MKSNAILLAKDGASVGVGMGQVNRVDSAGWRSRAPASERARGAVAASDAFFPFPDGLEVLIDAGVTAVVQPGGSVRDDEVIAAAKAAGVTHVPHRHAPLLPLTVGARDGGHPSGRQTGAGRTAEGRSGTSRSPSRADNRRRPRRAHMKPAVTRLAPRP